MSYQDQIISEIRRIVPQACWPIVKHLEPSEKVRAALDFQQKVIDQLKAEPMKSYAFFGPAGCGKTSNSMWLLSRAVLNAMRTPTMVPALPVRSSASAIVRQHHEFITADLEANVPKPDVTASDAKWRPTYIAELEKIGKMTEYKYEVLFTILDTIYERRPKVQFVMDTNLTINEFEQYFTDKISRRVAELCYRFDYFNERIIQPTEESCR